MNCNLPVSATTVVGLLSLSLIFMFDPTHDYPTTSDSVVLSPHESKIVTIPSTMSSFMQWSGSLIGNPYLWIQTDAECLEIVDFNRTIPDGLLVGFPMFNETGSATIINRGNSTILAAIKFTLAPSPEVLGTSKTWWYIIFAFIQTLVGGGLAMITPRKTVEKENPGVEASQGTLEAGSVGSSALSCIWVCCGKKDECCDECDMPPPPPDYTPVEMSPIDSTAASSTTSPSTVATPRPIAVSPSTASSSKPITASSTAATPRSVAASSSTAATPRSVTTASSTDVEPTVSRPKIRPKTPTLVTYQTDSSKPKLRPTSAIVTTDTTSVSTDSAAVESTVGTTMEAVVEMAPTVLGVLRRIFKRS